jgi:hypothetical protein
LLLFWLLGRISFGWRLVCLWRLLWDRHVLVAERMDRIMAKQLKKPTIGHLLVLEPAGPENPLGLGREALRWWEAAGPRDLAQKYILRCHLHHRAADPVGLAAVVAVAGAGIVEAASSS